MDKPLALKIQEFQQNISKIISESDLPIYILNYQIKDLAEEIDRLTNEYINKEINDYNQFLESKTNKENNETN